MISDSIKRLISIKEDQILIDLFARKEFYKKFSSKDGFKSYKNFTIISETEIEVSYEYGTTDNSYSFIGKFIIDITPEIRDEKISEIIK